MGSSLSQDLVSAFGQHNSSEVYCLLEPDTVSDHVLHGLGRVATWTWCSFLHAPKLEGLTDASGAVAMTVELYPLITR